MNRRLIYIGVAIIVGAFIGVYFYLGNLGGEERVYMGTMFVSDAGRSHGGFEYNAVWNATMRVQGSVGKLEFELDVGLGDALDKHVYEVRAFRVDDESMAMRVDGYLMELVYIEEDEIWNGAFNNHYIASWGGDAPPEEIRGRISPEVFPGFASHYYVELRLKRFQ